MGSFNTSTSTTDDDTNNNNNINDNDSNDVDSFFAPLSVCQTLRRSAGILYDNMALFLTMAAVVIVPILLILVVALFTISWQVEVETREHRSEYNSDQEDGYSFVNFFVIHARPLLLVLLLLMAVYTFVGIAMQAAMIRVVAEVYTTTGNQRPVELQQGMMEFIRHGMQVKVVCLIFCYNFLLHLGMLSVAICFEIVLGIALFIIGFIILNNPNAMAWIGGFVRLFVSMTSIYVQVSMFATIPSIVVEGHYNWYRAMQRSWDLVTTRRVFVFASHALYALVVWLPCTIFVIIVYVILGTTTNMGFMWSMFWMILVLAFVSMVLIPFHAIFQAVLYLTVRIEKEGCRQSVLVREIGALTEERQEGSGSASQSTMMMTRGGMMLSMDNDSSAGLYTPIFMTDDSILTVVDNDNNNIINSEGAPRAVGNNNDHHVC